MKLLIPLLLLLTIANTCKTEPRRFKDRLKMVLAAHPNQDPFIYFMQGMWRSVNDSNEYLTFVGNVAYQTHKDLPALTDIIDFGYSYTVLSADSTSMSIPQERDHINCMSWYSRNGGSRLDGNSHFYTYAYADTTHFTAGLCMFYLFHCEEISTLNYRRCR